MSKKIILKSVLHVPKPSCNILPVSCLSKDSACRIIFGVFGCEFQDLNTGMMIGSARMTEDLYYFDDNHARNKQAQGFIGNVCSNPVLEQIILWHNRLGHPSFSYLKYLLPYLFKGVD